MFSHKRKNEKKEEARIKGNHTVVIFITCKGIIKIEDFRLGLHRLDRVEGIYL